MTAYVLEFDCCECGRHIVDIAGVSKREPPLCGLCLACPDWFTDPQMRAVLDPDHDGIAAMDKPDAK